MWTIYSQQKNLQNQLKHYFNQLIGFLSEAAIPGCSSE